MGSWAELRVGGRDVFHWKSEVHPTFLFLFTEDDLTITPGDPDDPYDDPTVVLRTQVGVLADRLDALGVSADDMDEYLNDAVGQELETIRAAWMVTTGPEDLDDRVAAAVADLESLTFTDWVARVGRALAAPEPKRRAWRDYTELSCLLELWEVFDPRWMLRALLEACDPSADIVLDLTQLQLGGYLEAHHLDPQAAATVMFSYAVANGTPAVVVTEGVNDVEFLRAAVEVRKPHLARFVRFFDFDFHAEGGAGAAISAVKAFAAAGVNNRIIVLLDNDTAAREAMRGLRRGQLPGHYTVALYPDLDLATDYPTIGPTGTHNADVNGLAGSIELYLGTDVLTDPATGELSPVVWNTRIKALDAYQGGVADKGRIHGAFRAKVAAVREDPTVVAAQDWSGMDLVLEQLMDLLRTTGVPDPGRRDALLR